MDRRTVMAQLAALAAGAGQFLPGAAQAHPGAETLARPRVAMLVHPKMVLLDHVPAHTAFALAMCDVDLVWKAYEPVTTDLGVTVSPTRTFEEVSGPLDVLYVPGGLGGTMACMEDEAVIGFLQRAGKTAGLVTSVCTGSLLLGAAGLLKGYRATGHWHSCELLPLLGATLERERIVVDRNRITGGGVTAGLDHALVAGAEIFGEDAARAVQLGLEYSPSPPFVGGRPEEAPPHILSQVSARMALAVEDRRAAAQEAARRLRARG